MKQQIHGTCRMCMLPRELQEWKKCKEELRTSWNLERANGNITWESTSDDDLEKSLCAVRSEFW